MQQQHNRGGFTLIEVLVALVITALCASVFLGQLSRSARQQQVLENKTFATWVAQNTLAEYQLGTANGNIGSGSDIVEMANRRWQIETEVSTSDDLQKIEVRVSPESTGIAIVTLTGYLPGGDN